MLNRAEDTITSPINKNDDRDHEGSINVYRHLLKKEEKNPEAVAGAAISTGSYAGPVVEHFGGFGGEVVLQRGQLLPWVCEQL